MATSGGAEEVAVDGAVDGAAASSLSDDDSKPRAKKSFAAFEAVPPTAS